MGANGFTEGKGVVMCLEALSGSYDTCFDSEWLSDYDHERERVFFYVMRMKIANISYFCCGRKSMKKYLPTFKLWSRLFRGHFVHFGMSTMKKEKTHQTLLKLVQTYNENNNISSVGTAQNADIPIYAQQLFYNVVRNYPRNNEKNLVIESEVASFSVELKAEVVGTSFMRSLCNPRRDLVPMKEFEWVLGAENINELNTDQQIKSSTFACVVSAELNVQFELFIKRGMKGWASTVFGFEVKKINGASEVSGTISAALKEVRYCMDAENFSNAKEGGREEYFAFNESLLNNLQRLT